MKMWRNKYDVKIVEPVDALKLLLARFLNLLYYRTQVGLFRVLSNKLTFGTVVKVHNTYYVLTCVSDYHYEVVPEYEEYAFKRLTELVEPGAVFIDIGAHIGRYTFPMAKLVGEDGIVIAIEPDPVPFRALTRGKLNKFKNVVALNVALGDRNGSIMLCQKYITATSSIVEREKCRSFVEVPMETLDSIIKKLKISRIDVVKIDVEGAELKVLEGMVDTIRRFKPYMLVEVRSYNVNKFERLMRALGLSCEILMKRKNDVDYFDYFCYPNERTSMVLRVTS
jgi:FkbM family methyltransferase